MEPQDTLALILLAGLLLLVYGLLLWRGRKPKAREWILVDGSNVMHWQDGTPQISSVTILLGELAGRGYKPKVVFDANAGYLLVGRHCNDRAFARMIGLPANRVTVVPKGTQADGVILTEARDLGARVVTNDRYRDWAEAHPEVRNPGHLVTGGFTDKRLWLSL